jgi:glycosyltransferase involved in cell wall biosynthesis
MNKNIAFLYPSPINYRIPLFRILSKLYNIHFLFFQLLQHEIHVTNAVPRSEIFWQKLPNIPIPLMKSYKENAYGTPIIPLTLFWKLVRGKYDIIISKNFNSVATCLAFFASRLTKKPLIVWEENWYKGEGFARKIAFSLSSKILKKTTALIVPGTKAKEFFSSLGYDTDKIFIAPNASQLNKKFNRKESEKLKKDLGLKDKKNILYLGRLIERKGIKYLIEAFQQIEKKHKNISLVIAGSGRIELELKRYCKRLDLKNIQFLGYVEEEAKSILYSIADVFVLPSIKTNGLSEVWGLVVNEAMSSNLPVICTESVGAAYDLIKNGVNGYIVEEANSKALAQAILLILDDVQITREMGLKSKEIIDHHFTYQDMANGFIGAIDYTYNNRKKRNEEIPESKN